MLCTFLLKKSAVLSNAGVKLPPWKPTYHLFQAFNWSKINCGKIHISKRTRLGVSFSVPLCTTLESFRFEDENEYEYEI